MTNAIETKLVRGKMFANLTREADRDVTFVWFALRRWSGMKPAGIAQMEAEHGMSLRSAS